jgi:hypothetical protein
MRSLVTFKGKKKVMFEDTYSGHYGGSSYIITGKKRDFPNAR